MKKFIFTLIFVFLLAFNAKSQDVIKIQIAPQTYMVKGEMDIIVTTFDTTIARVLRATWNCKTIPSNPTQGYKFWFPIKSEARIITNVASAK